MSRFHRVSPVTAAKMEALGIHTGADLAAQPLEVPERHFGSSAGYFQRAALGQDDRPARANRVRKSIGAERTFETDVAERAELEAALGSVLDAVMERIKAKGAAGRTVTLKLKFSDFTQITRARSARTPVRSRADIEEFARAILVGELPLPRPVRLLGVTLSNLVVDTAVDTAGDLA